MPRGIDEVQFVYFSVARLVFEGRRLRLDGDAAFAFQVHAVENLFTHFAVGESSAVFDKTVGQGGFAVVDVSNDGKITDVVHG